jgi:hypothetical protein
MTDLDFLVKRRQLLAVFLSKLFVYLDNCNFSLVLRILLLMETDECHLMVF